MRIFIPGRQYVVYTGRDGKFLIQNLEVGEYELYYAIGEQIVNYNKNVKVVKDNRTDLGVVSFCAELAGNKAPSAAATVPTTPCDAGSTEPHCVDKDNDKFVASLDCNDNDPAIRPGAVEICDGVDNNCDGIIDNVASVVVNNGTGVCDNATIKVQSCFKNYADCDGQSSNGCETNISKDDDNCGFCGNACPANEICVGGSC